MENNILSKENTIYDIERILSELPDIEPKCGPDNPETFCKNCTRFYNTYADQCEIPVIDILKYINYDVLSAIREYVETERASTNMYYSESRINLDLSVYLTRLLDYPDLKENYFLNLLSILIHSFTRDYIPRIINMPSYCSAAGIDEKTYLRKLLGDAYAYGKPSILNRNHACPFYSMNMKLLKFLNNSKENKPAINTNNYVSTDQKEIDRQRRLSAVKVVCTGLILVLGYIIMRLTIK